MIQPPESDRAIGIDLYATDFAPCQATLRAEPEDFLVEEWLVEAVFSAEPKPGFVPVYRVEKHSIDTMHVAKALGNALKSRVTYAGMKDKRASAVQYLTPASARSERPQLVEDANFSARLVGYLPRPITRSMMSGNRFKITLRNCCPEIGERISQVLTEAVALKLPNFFGPQRFGIRNPVTHRVGGAIVRGRFDEALTILISEPRVGDSEETLEARRLIAEGEFERGGRLLPEGQDVEKMVARRLAREPLNLVGALRAVPIAVRRLYVQAFQSYLFNRTLSAAIAKQLDISTAMPGDNWAELAGDGLNLGKVHGVREPMTGRAVPVVQLAGYAYRNYGSRFDECLRGVMEEESVEPGEFFVKEMQEVSVEGGFRRPHLQVSEPSSEVSEGLARIRFVLPRGGYATVLLREIVKPADPFASGFA